MTSGISGEAAASWVGCNALQSFRLFTRQLVVSLAAFHSVFLGRLSHSMMAHKWKAPNGRHRLANHQSWGSSVWPSKIVMA